MDWRILDSFVIFSKVSLRKEDLNSELGSIQQIWTIFKSCHCGFWHFYQIFQNCLNLLNVCGGLWSLIKLLCGSWTIFLSYGWGSISSRSTWLYHSTFEARLEEIPGGGRQFWLKRDDSKHHFKYKYIYIRYFK